MPLYIVDVVTIKPRDLSTINCRPGFNPTSWNSHWTKQQTSI